MAEQQSNPSSNNDRNGDNLPDIWWTIPNALCVIRLIGSFVLIGLALAEMRNAFLYFFLFLALTDWVDGKLAILLNQRSAIGPAMDSLSDATMFGALLFGTVWLEWELIRNEAVWFACALVSYAIAKAYGWAKFKRWPSYHTRLAKTSWWLIALGAVSALAGWSAWPLRFALLAASLANVEAILITAILDHWRADLSSIFAAKADSTSQ